MYIVLFVIFGFLVLVLFVVVVKIFNEEVVECNVEFEILWMQVEMECNVLQDVILCFMNEMGDFVDGDLIICVMVIEDIIGVIVDLVNYMIEEFFVLVKCINDVVVCVVVVFEIV